MSTRIKVDHFTLQTLVREFAVKKSTKSICLTEIQWAKIKKEIPIHKFVVNAKEVFVGMSRWVGGQGDIVQATLQKQSNECI